VLLLGFVLWWRVIKTVGIQLLGIGEWIGLGAVGSVPECCGVYVLVLPARLPLVGIGDAVVGLTIVLFAGLGWPGVVLSFGLSIHSGCMSICAQLAGSRRSCHWFCIGWSGPCNRLMM